VSPLQRAQDLLPKVALVRFHTVVLQQGEELILEGDAPMMLRLIANVSNEVGSSDWPSGPGCAIRTLQMHFLTFLGLCHPQKLTFLGYKSSKTQLFSVIESLKFCRSSPGGER
jgi:hypothetical protein